MLVTELDYGSFRTRLDFAVGQATAKKAASTPEPAYNLTGQLYLAPSGWILLSVPNALVRGVFSAMQEPGIELPPGPDGKLNAHITVFRPDELEQIGGADKVTERGKTFSYTIGRLVTVEPDGWSEMRRVWFLTAHSEQLQALRRSYGLSSLPKEGQHPFHITCAVLRKGVLGRNETSKGQTVSAA